MRVIVDFPGAPRRVFSSPRSVLRSETTEGVVAVIEAAEAAARAGSFVAGFVSYEAAPAFDAALRVRAGTRMPLAWFGVFDEADRDRPAVVRAEPDSEWAVSPSKAEFMAAVERIREEIAAGRTYQVNLTARLSAQLGFDPLHLYEALRRAQGTGYHAYLDIGDFTVLSASPELFFDVRGGTIRTKPMKGTRPRGRWREEDEALAHELAASEKDRAENLMIVDLLRNDLGRVAAMGSVKATSLFDIEAFRTVHQMTSTIEAELLPDARLVDIFGALFPCGSITGAPKVSTMGLITELEKEPREVYCGAIGVIEPGGSATFSVAIRTVWVDRGSGRALYGAGAGITFDSDPAAEYAEVVAKAAVLTEAWPDFELLETMRAESGRVVRMERHIARLMGSAQYFGVPVCEADVRSALAGACATVGTPARIRLLVGQEGGLRVESGPLVPADAARTGVALSPVSSRDRFLFHKTTHRRAYQQKLAERPECWDVLLWNERGELTEFTRGNVVLDIDGELLTPPVAAGLLAGTFRAELLEAGALREATLLRADLARASRVWLINSLREWLEVRPDQAMIHAAG